MRSIHRWLLGALILGLTVASLIAGFGIFHTARHEAGELFDYELRTVAMSLPQNIETADQAEQPIQGYSGIADDRIVIDIWSLHGERLYHGLSETELPLPATDGFGELMTHRVRWRFYRVRQPNRVVVVAQPYSIRHDLGYEMAFRIIWPLLFFLPAIILLVLYVVRRGLSPINDLSKILHGRSVRFLSAVELDRAPDEIRPLVTALNALLKRLADSANAQRNFVADAAHELRTPLTALKLQIQAATRTGMSEAEMAKLPGLESRVNRIIHLAQQLLVMAREDAKEAVVLVPLPLRMIAEEVVADLSLLAEAQRVDLGLEIANADDGEPFRILGDASSLSMLLNNLIENAIRHSDAGGKVDLILSVSRGVVDITVIDSGTGMPEKELTRARDRFYRGEFARGQGSGLGLAIAASIAERHGAAFELRNRDDKKGLIVSVTGLQAAM